MKVSFVVPTLRVGNMLKECISSFGPHIDELIIIDDEDKSLAYKQNKGMRLATKEYIIVCNDDVTLKSGNLKDLCIPNQVVSPTVDNKKVYKRFHGHMFCIPRRIYAEVGGFDESFDGAYGIDSDLWYRLIQAGYPPVLSSRVEVYHNHISPTIKTLSDRENDPQRAIDWFVSKWGEEAREVVKI